MKTKLAPSVNVWWLLGAFLSAAYAERALTAWFVPLSWCVAGTFIALFVRSIQRAIDQRKDDE